MDEQKSLVPQEDAPQQEAPQAPRSNVRRTWVTDLYDRMNISVRTLDIMLVVLAVFIVAVIIIASQKH